MIPRRQQPGPAHTDQGLQQDYTPPLQPITLPLVPWTCRLPRATLWFCGSWFFCPFPTQFGMATGTTPLRILHPRSATVDLLRLPGWLIKFRRLVAGF